MGRRDLLFMVLIVGGGGMIAAPLAPPWNRNRGEVLLASRPRPTIVAQVDAAFADEWRRAGLTPALPASDLTLIRRITLALTGKIPSLALIRRFETSRGPDRLAGWVDVLLAERRTADYLAERFARAAVGTEAGPFLVYRRRRLVAWLSDELDRNRPFDAIVRDLIASEGFATDHPATNFVTITFNPATKAYDPERLAARVARAFLGVRIDCAQCHDHPFEPWKRADFQGLAAYFGQVEPGFTGVIDGHGEFRLPTKAGAEAVAISPQVPFAAELLPKRGTRRERLASWVTDRRNTRFAAATVNRVWALLCGRPLVEPIDDLASAGVLPAALTLLADDFVRHDFDLRHLIRSISATRAFALDSATSEADSLLLAAAWAAFPMTRLRPEQVAGAFIQAGTTATIDSESHILFRLAASGGINDFVARHGDAGEDEFDQEETSTIPQRLLMMNGDLVQKSIQEEIGTVAGRIAALASTDRVGVETAYLVTLTRRPTPAEATHFEARLAGTRGPARQEAVTDLIWVLLNSTEFSYNH